MIIDLIKVIILGIVEGITEWLPISSTGHLILVGNVLKPDLSAGFIEMFNVVIQLGAILAVIVIFFNKLWPFHTKRKADRQWFANPTKVGFAGKFQRFANNYLYMDKIVLWLKIAVSSIPALIVGVFFEDWLEEHMHAPIPVAVMLIVFGIIFIIVERNNKHKRPRVRKTSMISWRDAFLIGCFQALALLPGTSRSGATIIGALILGLSRVCAAEYSFFLAIPAMIGASGIKLLKFGFSFTTVEAVCLIAGTAVAFIVSLFVIRFLMNFVARHDFKVFGYYRIILGIIVIIFGIYSMMNVSGATGSGMFSKILTTFLVSMVPIVELRGAIPIGVGLGLSPAIVYITAVIGNMVPVAFIYLFARKVLVWGSDKPVIGKFFNFCLVKGESGGRKLKAKAGRGLFVALLIFVGIPLPGTGAWTGTLAASILDMGFKKSVVAVTLGVLMAGIIMATISFGVASAIA